MVRPTAEQILRVMKAKGYRVFDDFNLYGIRSSDTKANTFNDLVGVLWKNGDTWVNYAWPATTDPGTYYRNAPMNVHGTAIMKPGQYARAYKLGMHTGYPALEQCAPITVYRDANRNDTLELNESKVETGLFKTNIHRANPRRPSTQVDKWSAGCQVIADPKHFDELMSLARRNGGPFTYTLLTEQDFDQ